MKTRLTREESQHLIDLGVPKEKASDIEEYNDPISQWTHRGAPIFKLEDFLNGEILPKNLNPDKLIDFSFSWNSNKELWLACYLFVHHSIKHAEELIDALYQLACWYYGEYLKSEKK